MTSTTNQATAQKEMADSKAGQENTLSANYTPSNSNSSAAHHAWLIKNCIACGAHFIPKSQAHELCICCWLWKRVGQNLRANLQLIQKANGV